MMDFISNLMETTIICFTKFISDRWIDILSPRPKFNILSRDCLSFELKITCQIHEKKKQCILKRCSVFYFNCSEVEIKVVTYNKHSSKMINFILYFDFDH